MIIDRGVNFDRFGKTHRNPGVQPGASSVDSQALLVVYLLVTWQA